MLTPSYLQKKHPLQFIIPVLHYFAHIRGEQQVMPVMALIMTITKEALRDELCLVRAPLDVGLLHC